MLKLKLQYFGHLMWRVDSLEKTLILAGIGGRRRRGRQRMRWLDGITDSMDMGLSKLRSWWWTGRPGVLRFMGSQRVGPAWATETELRKEFMWNILTSLYYAFLQNVFLSSRWEEFFEMNPIACPLCHLTSWGEDWKFSFQPPKVSTNISAFNCLYLINR